MAVSVLEVVERRICSTSSSTVVAFRVVIVRSSWRVASTIATSPWPCVEISVLASDKDVYRQH